VLLTERLEALLSPGRRPVEHIVGALRDHRAADMLVAVPHVDVARARLVRDLRDRASERGVVDEGVHEHVLPLADVRADTHGKLGERPQTILTHETEP